MKFIAIVNVTSGIMRDYNDPLEIDYNFEIENMILREFREQQGILLITR